MSFLIKKILRENLLNERLTNVDDDVDSLYNSFFKSDIDKLNQSGYIDRSMFKKEIIDTSILKSEDCVKAHELNPCQLVINFGSNFYHPRRELISISVIGDAVQFVLDSGGSLAKTLDVAKIRGFEHEIKYLISDFSEERIKGSIHHELAHWVDDTLNNRHLSKILKRAEELKTKEFKGKPFDTHYIEIQGQIHNVKQLYNKYKDIWDKLSFMDMISYSSPLLGLYNRFDFDIREKWILTLKKRMAREGLLGKNMY